MKCTHVYVAQTTYLFFTKLCLADEIAEPRSDMNIKVAAFTVSEKSINTKHPDKSAYRYLKISFLIS